MATTFQEELLGKYHFYFPEKVNKRFSADRPYVTKEIKALSRKMRQLFRNKNHKEATTLKNKIRGMTRQAAALYYQKEVSHLLDSKPGQWYKRIKQMTGKTQTGLDFGYDDRIKQLQIA